MRKFKLRSDRNYLKTKCNSCAGRHITQKPYKI